MTVNIKYDEEKDIDCLITKGGGSNNSPGARTKTYEQLLEYTTDISDREKVREFVRKFIKENGLNPVDAAVILQGDWDKISKQYEERAEKVFGVHIQDEITAYQTITGRFPYNTKNKFFYISAKGKDVNGIIMHELWHFYTLLRFPQTESKLGAEKYNDLKESLTVLLNIECKDLMGESVDKGYPQHQELRGKVADIWSKTKDIEVVWNTLAQV